MEICDEKYRRGVFEMIVQNFNGDSYQIEAKELSDGSGCPMELINWDW